MSQQDCLSAEFDPAALSTLDKGGARLTYIPIAEVVNRLNSVLDDFSVIEADAFPAPNDPQWIIGKAKLQATIDGQVRTAVGFGGVKVKLTRKDQTPVDLGDEYKGAVSDAIKKAAQLWGVGLYLARSETAATAVYEADEAHAAGYADATHMHQVRGDILRRVAALDDEAKQAVLARIDDAGYRSRTLTLEQAIYVEEWLTETENT